jgi:N-acetylmuramic acid 6-phosphate etherase
MLGIDGGGTSTIALLARRGDQAGSDPVILGRSCAGPSNLQAVGQAALPALDHAVREAFAAAGIPRQTVNSACLGLAGADRAGDQKIIRHWAESVYLADRIEITNDVSLLLDAGTPEGWGIAVVAGTGSIAYGRTSNGRTARAGGWGYMLGDEGSGYALVLAGLQAVARAADGRGPATVLAELFLSRFNVRQPQELIPVVYRGGWDRAKLAALAPVILEAAAEDNVAAKIIAEGAQALAAAVAAVIRQLGWENQSLPLALAGGVLLGNEGYRQRLLAELAGQQICLAEVTQVVEPVVGAIRRLVRQDAAQEK